MTGAGESQLLGRQASTVCRAGLDPVRLSIGCRAESDVRHYPNLDTVVTGSRDMNTMFGLNATSVTSTIMGFMRSPAYLQPIPRWPAH